MLLFRSSFVFGACLLIALLGANNGIFGQKNDTLYFLNGDRISGEIKQYKYGYLNYKTYGAGTISVKNDKMSTFYSKKSFDILMENGARRFGSFDTSSLVQFVKIISANDTLLTPLIEIVEITPIKNIFWKRLSGSVDIGFSYSRATTLSQLNFSSDVKYTQRQYFTNLSLTTINSVQENTENSRNNKNDATLTYYRRIRNNWFGVGAGSVEQSTQLGLDLRLQGGAGIGNELVHTNSNNLLASAGLVVNKEWSADTSLARINTDVFGMVQYKLFLFSKPEIDLTSNASAFPSLNVANRWRLNYDIKFKIEIITDMYLSFSYYITYDTRPPSATSSQLDYSISSSFGYTF